jgi:hypothetical protein
MLDSVTWGAFTLTFTVLGGLGAWLAYRRRGLRSGMRWAATTLLVPAAYLTHTLKMLSQVASAITHWATSFVWNPLVWVGLGLFAVSVLLFVVAGRLPGRERKAAPAGGGRKQVGAGAPALSGGDAEMAEIEALLKRRGIS